MLQLGITIAFATACAAKWSPAPIQFVQEICGRNVTICVDGRSPHATFAGKMGFRDRTSQWVSVCANVRGPVRQGQMFIVRPILSSKFGGNVAKAGNIVAKYFAAALSPDACAALQLAVWEAIEDGDAQPGFGGGRFMAKSSPAVMAMAAQFYQASGEQGEALYLQTGNTGGQSQITTRNEIQ